MGRDTDDEPAADAPGDGDRPDIESGDVVACDSCRTPCPVSSAVLELFGFQVWFGPAGEDDMWCERDGTVVCNHCVEDEFGDEIEDLEAST